MFIPVGDSPNPPGTAIVNYAIIALNVAVFVLFTMPLSSQAPDPSDPILQEYFELVRSRIGSALSDREILASISSYDLFVYRNGFRPAEGSVLTLFSSMFLHGGFMHLAGNMLFLWIYGDNVEHRLGRVLYLLAYLGTGVAATLFHAAFDLDSNTPMVGASGAISGVLGFYFIFFPRNLVKIFVALFPFFVNVVMVPARIVLGFYIVVSNILPFIMSAGSGGGGVAHGAHIGGFIAGVAAAFIVDRRERDATPKEYRHGKEPAKGPSTSEQISSLVAAGRMSEAAQVYFGAHERSGTAANPRDVLVIGRWLSENDHPTAALSAFRRILRDHPSGPLAADAHLGAGLVQLRNLGRPTSAYQHFLDVIDLAPGTEAAEIAREGIEFIDARGGGGPPSR
ncbi:MAG: rhomboid family intramembrane serine protease [Planctomycetota bacterium]